MAGAATEPGWAAFYQDGFGLVFWLGLCLFWWGYVGVEVGMNEGLGDVEGQEEADGFGDFGGV